MDCIAREDIYVLYMLSTVSCVDKSRIRIKQIGTSGSEYVNYSTAE
jgi:hypothetical protein